MEQIRLVGLDLDGTLLNGEKQISPATYDALRRAHEAGVFLVPVTGRPHRAIPRLVRELPFVRYLISCNGAAIWDKNEALPLREKTIPQEETLGMTALLAEAGLPFEVLCRGVGYAEAWVYEWMLARNPRSTFMPGYIRDTRETVPSLPDFLRTQTQGAEEFFIVLPERGQRAALGAKLEAAADITIVDPVPWAMEITARGADKGEALLHLAAVLDIPQTAVMAIGDSGNDLAMLRAARLSVAMANAPREIRDICTHTTKSNEEDGVGWAIERFVLAHNS